MIFDSKDNSKDKPEKVKPEKTVDESLLIGEDKAKEIALKKAELKEAETSRIKVKLDFDNGLWEYEVEIKAGRTEYDADINAKTGEIIKWEVDLDD